jgi:hypothetical protein
MRMTEFPSPDVDVRGSTFCGALRSAGRLVSTGRGAPLSHAESLEKKDLSVSKKPPWLAEGFLILINLLSINCPAMASGVV